MSSEGDIKNFRGHISTDTNNSANQFVANFNLKIKEILNEIEEFQDLNELYKLNIIVFQNRDKFKDIWSRPIEVNNYHNPKSFKPIRTYNYFETSSNITPKSTGISNYSYTYYSVFGGIDLDVTKINIQKEVLASESTLYKKVISQKPKKEALYWQVKLD